MVKILFLFALFNYTYYFFVNKKEIPKNVKSLFHQKEKCLFNIQTDNDFLFSNQNRCAGMRADF